MAFFNLGLQELIILSFMGLSCFGVIGVCLLVIFIVTRGGKNEDD